MSRRNTVTYDLNPAHTDPNLPFTNLVQQLIPVEQHRQPDQSVTNDSIYDDNHLNENYQNPKKKCRSNSRGSNRRRASSVFSRLVHRENGRLSEATVTSGPSAREKKKELRLARISLCIVWLFIFCHVWKLIPTFYTTFISEDNNVGFDVQWPDWLNIIDRISHTFITLNSSLNFLIYVVV